MSDQPKLSAHLGYRGGVNTWVMWLGLVPIVGILAAVAIPAYKDSQKPAAPPQGQQPATPVDWSKYEVVREASPQSQQPSSGGYGANAEQPGRNLFSERVEGLIKRAEQGDVGAQVDLAMMYAKGEIAPVNLGAAFYWFETAALAGQKNAQVSLGWAYMSDFLGLAPNYQLAMWWNRKAADQGFGRGSENIGLLYGNGWGVPVNYFEAASWYKKAIAQGADTGQAQFDPGRLYEDGRGVQRNLHEAANLYRVVVEKYGDSEFASVAKTRLDSVQNLRNSLEEGTRTKARLSDKDRQSCLELVAFEEQWKCFQ